MHFLVVGEGFHSGWGSKQHLVAWQQDVLSPFEADQVKIAIVLEPVDREEVFPDLVRRGRNRRMDEGMDCALQVRVSVDDDVVIGAVVIDQLVFEQKVLNRNGSLGANVADRDVMEDGPILRDPNAESRFLTLVGRNSKDDTSLDGIFLLWKDSIKEDFGGDPTRKWRDFTVNVVL